MSDMAKLGKIFIDASNNSLNIPQEKIYELGNWTTITTVKDVPDLTWDLAFDPYPWVETEEFRDPRIVSFKMVYDEFKRRKGTW